MVSKENIEDELYRLLPKNPHHLRRLMQMIDCYAYTVSQRQQEQIFYAPTKWDHLRPGDTDINSGMRRCKECGKVKNLHGAFAKRATCPYGRMLRCIDCRPPGWWGGGKKRPDRYLCRMCRLHKPLSAFPDGKRRNPTFNYRCKDCGK